jgi:hypothetical protein
MQLVRKHCAGPDLSLVPGTFMKIIYRAVDIMEAHIVAGMLRANDIEAYVGGHYLQGAVGDLAVHGLANVFVDQKDLPVAQDLIKAYEDNAGSDILEHDITESDTVLPWLA